MRMKVKTFESVKGITEGFPWGIRGVEGEGGMYEPEANIQDQRFTQKATGETRGRCSQWYRNGKRDQVI